MNSLRLTAKKYVLLYFPKDIFDILRLPVAENILRTQVIGDILQTPTIENIFNRFSENNKKTSCTFYNAAARQIFQQVHNPVKNAL